METLSKFTQAQTYGIEFRESRIRRAMSIIEKLPPGHFLDVGCSNGDWALYWANKGWKCFGIDIGRDSVGKAKRKGIDARVCDLNKDIFPFEGRSFDLIFAGEIIEHLIDTDGFLEEVHRCLKQDGHFLLTTPNLASFENRVRILLGRYPIWVDYKLGGSGHLRAYTPRALKRQLRQNGFSIIRHTGNWVPFLPQRFVDDIRVPVMSITGLLFPNLAMDIILLARKKAQTP